MRLQHDPNGTPEIIGYDLGDLVVLRVDEPGELAMGRTGDWGRITRVSNGGALVDMAIMGGQRGRTVTRLTDIPRRILLPCNDQGQEVPLQRKFRLALQKTRG